MVLQSLSHLVLRIIFESLDDADVVCLLLTCQQLYGHRKSVAVFSNNQNHTSHTQRVIRSYYRLMPIFSHVRLPHQPHHPSPQPSVIINTVSVIKTDLSVVNTADFSSIPSTCTSLLFGKLFNQLIVPGHLTHAHSITSIRFGEEFDQKIVVGSLPNSLIRLQFGRSFDQRLEHGSLPPSLQCLLFGDKLSADRLYSKLELAAMRRVTGSSKLPFPLPRNNRFNEPLSPGVLPQSLTKLHFGYGFDQDLKDGVLPDSIETLYFGSGFRRIQDRDALPRSLTKLYLGSLFEQHLERQVLPLGLKTLMFGALYASIINPGDIPSSVTILRMSERYELQIDRNVLPESLRILSFGQKPHLLPVDLAAQAPHLHTLVVSNKFNHPLSIGALPQRLVRLSLGSKFDQPLDANVLPPTLEQLSLDYHYRHPFVSGSLPLSLKNIEFHAPKFTEPTARLVPILIDECVPSSLESIDLHCDEIYYTELIRFGQIHYHSSIKNWRVTSAT
ncbi:hypothetical protein SAMD00019534_012040 [Acytostelium subglobosum LB1]|uniref:hypothetical protein n=1 Tax=Acytostelium subglobosum LB1 TaxID=1410327 RepID=UPI000644B955|nr:hypothetical protein SAMD00019534_012040 [Acytostelium subglobosum LB1]GAM18029.1 hypothetical protein SAMD00019534_012040 [Acytostelium subglobosum LB1]|eukprot:XP_012758625.1 hypothetical protein SAMD00019534_012040 [Acytostelium subglobosum LB1]